MRHKPTNCLQTELFFPLFVIHNANAVGNIVHVVYIVINCNQLEYNTEHTRALLWIGSMIHICLSPTSPEQWWWWWFIQHKPIVMVAKFTFPLFGPGHLRTCKRQCYYYYYWILPFHLGMCSADCTFYNLLRSNDFSDRPCKWNLPLGCEECLKNVGDEVDSLQIGLVPTESNGIVYSSISLTIMIENGSQRSAHTSWKK